MRITLHSGYLKAYKKRIVSNEKLRVRVSQRINTFQENPSDPILKNHLLKNRLESVRSFSITGDIRVLNVVISKDKVAFLNIGSHNQVY